MFDALKNIDAINCFYDDDTSTLIVSTHQIIYLLSNKLFQFLINSIHKLIDKLITFSWDFSE